MLVNSAIPEESVTAVRVLVGEDTPGVEGVPELGPLCWTSVTVSPATGLPLASSTVTAASVLAPAVVSEGSLEKTIDLATPVTDPDVEAPHCQLTTVMPDPHQIEHRTWMGALRAGAEG
jgi:hypothetical protein